MTDKKPERLIWIKKGGVVLQQKAVFLDIDGTYTHGSPFPSQRNVRAVQAAREKGHKVFLNTGRSYGFIPKEVLEAAPLDGVIAGNGAYVKLGRQVLQSLRMSREALRQITEYALASGASCIYEGEKHNLCLHIENPDKDWGIVTGPDDFDEKYGDIAITKLTVMGQIEEGFLGVLREAGMRAIQFSHYAETVIAGCSKAVGMEIMLKAIGVSRENSIAMGDSLNDLEMISYAGMGIAMENAVPELKEIADAVSVHASDSGVGQAIEQYIL